MKKVLIFIGMFILWLCLMWVGGYDFNTRNPQVAYGMVVGIMLSLLAATFPRGE